MVDAGKGGRIVNISSVHEEACNMPDDGPTAWPRAGVRNLTRSMALELGPHGITVNDVAPGMILTPMNRRRSRMPTIVPTPGLRSRSAALERLRISRPWWSSSARIASCTGGTYLVDGGWMLSWPPV